MPAKLTVAWGCRAGRACWGMGHSEFRAGQRVRAGEPGLGTQEGEEQDYGLAAVCFGRKVGGSRKTLGGPYTSRKF